MAQIKYSIRCNPDTIPVTHSNWYPPVAVSAPNADYVLIISPDLASAASEMTTLNQYLYQSWTICDEYRNIRRVIQRIAAVEQHHYAIIGQLIALLGGNPECRSIKPNSYWRGNMVDYCRDIRELLAEDAESEKFAAHAYAAQSRQIRDPCVSKMLARLSLDESLHYRILCDFLAQIQESKLPVLFFQN